MEYPPKQIDGANVLYFADVSKLKKTSQVQHFSGNIPQLKFARIAICQYKNKSETYLFHCNQSWKTENDDLYGSVEEAKESVMKLYHGLTNSMLHTFDNK